MEISYWHFIDDSDTTVFCDSSFEKLKILAIVSNFEMALGLCEHLEEFECWSGGNKCRYYSFS